MSDHADIVREILRSLSYPGSVAGSGDKRIRGIAALDALVAERDEAKAQFWQQRHEWAAATGKNQEIIDGLLVRAEAAEATLEREKRASDVESEMLTLRYQAAEATLEKQEHEWSKALIAAEAEVARLREDTRLVQQWFLSKPWEGEPDARDFGGGPYSPDERAIGYGTYCDPRMLPPMLARSALEEEA